MRAALHLARRVTLTTLQVLGVALIALLGADLVEHGEVGGAQVARLVLMWRDVAPVFLSVGGALAVSRLRDRGELLGLSLSGVGRGTLALGIAVPLLGLALVLGTLAELGAPTALDRAASTDDQQASGQWLKADGRFVRLGPQVLIADVEAGELVARTLWMDQGGERLSVPDLTASSVPGPLPLEPDRLSHASPSERGAVDLDGSWLWHRLLAPLAAGALALGLAGLVLGTRARPAVATAGAGIVSGAVVLAGLVAAPTTGVVALGLALVSCAAWARRVYWTSM
ncbi:MAG: hypothetical protein GY913_22230 [Proteobacteria bacterium]|nr:hypothetical protein [Pseudomonadota bacterium]MCP4919629.1 hypothetical protein [Pseudomonadota bacterium]